MSKQIDYPGFTLQDRLITVGGKVVSYEMLYAMIAKRFHQCLHKEASNVQNRAIYAEMPDNQLVHKVCRKERLTLFNFLKYHMCDYNRSVQSKLEFASGENIITTNNEERLKDLINKEYEHYFRRKNGIDIYATQMFKTDVIFNDLKSKIEVEY